MRGIGTTAWLLGMGLLSGCAELPDVVAGECGNRVLEAGEDCDGDSEGVSCRERSEASPCRYDCTDAACPSGLICSPTHKICLEPSGAVGAPQELLPIGAARLLRHDVDADGREDLVGVGQRAISVHYFEGDQWASSFDAPSALTVPVIGASGSDDLPDLIFNIDVGVSLLRGEEGRTLSPTLYSTIPLSPGHLRLIPVDARVSVPGQEYVEIVRFGQTTGVVGTSFAEQGNSTTLLPPTSGKVLDAIAAGWIDPLAGCDAIAMAFEGAAEFHVVVPCTEQGKWNEDLTEVPLKNVPLPSGQVTWAGVLAADLDADGLLELIVGTEDAMTDARKLEIFSYDSATATITAKGVSLPIGTSSEVCDDDANTPGLLTGPPLVIQDLDGDGDMDFIDEHGVLLTGDGGFVRAECNLVPEWRNVIIDNFNLDGFPDLAIVPPEGGLVAVYIGTDKGLFTPHTFIMDSKVKGIYAGDLDGDVIEDIVVWREPIDGGESGGDILSVIYGSISGGPEQPVDIGRLGEIQEISMGVTIGADGRSDLAVVSKAAEAPTLAIIPGDQGRRMQSPYLLYAEYQNPVLSTPKRIGGGDFDGDGILDVAVLAQETPPLASSDTLRLWLVRRDGDVNLDSTRSYPIDIPQLEGTSALALAALDLEAGPDLPSGADELLIFSRDLDGIDRLYVARAAEEPPLSGGMDVAGLGSPLNLAADVQALDAPLQVVDIDGDERRDVALTTVGGELLVIWNDAGSFGPDNRLVLQLPGAMAGTLFTPAITDLAFFDLDQRPPLELAYITGGALRVVRLTAPAGSTRPQGVEEVLLASSPDTGQPLVLAGKSVIDFDADLDGLPDLVVGGESSISLIRSLPTRAP